MARFVRRACESVGDCGGGLAVLPCMMVVGFHNTMAMKAYRLRRVNTLPTQPLPPTHFLPEQRGGRPGLLHYRVFSSRDGLHRAVNGSSPFRRDNEDGNEMRTNVRSITQKLDTQHGDPDTIKPLPSTRERVRCTHVRSDLQKKSRKHTKTQNGVSSNEDLV